QLVLLGMQPDEKLGYFSKNGMRGEFEQVRIWSRGHVVRIAPHVRIAQGMAERARASGLRGGRGVRRNGLAGEQRDGFVAAGAIPARSHPLGSDVIRFHRRIEGVSTRKMMRAGKPLFIDRGVASGGAAGLRFDQELRGDYPA